MKISILQQKFKRTNNQTCCIILACIKDNNGIVIPNSHKRFIGIAKCCSEDNYDFNIGKKLSLARAELKMFDYFDKRTIAIRRIAQDMIKDSEELSNKAVKQYYHNVKYIKDIISKIK